MTRPLASRRPASQGLASRRQFLSQSAAAASALALGAYVNPAAAQESKSPSERLRIAAVGTTGRAGGNLTDLSSQDIVALADVDAELLEKGAAKFPEARKYRDFRVMLEKEADKIDAVLSGRFRLVVRGHMKVLGPGQWIEIPRGAVHNAAVMGDEPVVTLDAVKL